MAETAKADSDGRNPTHWYEVQEGDRLSKIAKRLYGDAALYPRILEANRDVLKDPNRIEVGQKLRIP